MADEVQTETILAGAENATAADAAKVTADAEVAKAADAEVAKAADGDETAKKAEGAPETYGDFTAPEGVELASEAVEGFKSIAKELNLSQDAAQKLVDYHVKHSTEQAQAQATAFKEMSEGWAAASKADKDIGGANFEANTAAARKAITEFGTPELVTALNTSGLGNHPEVVRVFAKVGKMMAEDGVVTGKSAAEPPKSAAQTLYPGMN